MVIPDPLDDRQTVIPGGEYQESLIEGKANGD